jgi:hypothetical protein
MASILSLAPGAFAGAASATGSLTVSFTIRPSILMSVRAPGGMELTGKGAFDASVTLPLPVPASPEGNGEVVAEIPLDVQSRVANAGMTSGYRLSATLVGNPGWVIEIDGNRIDTASAADVTLAKAIGDPYGTTTSHVIRVICPRGTAEATGSGYLVLKACPKSM